MITINEINSALQSASIKSQTVTTFMGYKMALVNLNRKVSYQQVLESLAQNSLDTQVEAKLIGKTVVVYVPGSKA